MFLIIAKWQDNSDSIFLVGKDPTNRKLPNWSEMFTKLDTIANPADATLQYARVSRDFVLLRDEETLEYSLDDPVACSGLKPLKLTKDLHLQWYQTLMDNREISDEPIDDEEPPEF
jgi:hypothetical protein